LNPEYRRPRRPAGSEDDEIPPADFDAFPQAFDQAEPVRVVSPELAAAVRDRVDRADDSGAAVHPVQMAQDLALEGEGHAGPLNAHRPDFCDRLNHVAHAEGKIPCVDSHLFVRGIVHQR